MKLNAVKNTFWWQYWSKTDFEVFVDIGSKFDKLFQVIKRNQKKHFVVISGESFWQVILKTKEPVLLWINGLTNFNDMSNQNLYLIYGGGRLFWFC